MTGVSGTKTGEKRRSLRVLIRDGALRQLWGHTCDFETKPYELEDLVTFLKEQLRAAARPSSPSSLTKFLLQLR